MTDLLPLDQPHDRVSVLLPLPLDAPYDYKAASGLGLARGDIVEVPLGRRLLAGVVLGPGSEEIAPERLRAVIRRFDVPALPAAVLELIDWTAAWTLAARGAVLRMAISVPAAFTPPAPTLLYTPAPEGDWAAGARLTPARRRVLSALSAGAALEPRDLAHEAAVGPAVLKGMQGVGMLVPCRVAAAAPFDTPVAGAGRKALTEEQRAAAATLRTKVAAGAFAVTTVDGVTGSGKTEVYFEAVAAALSAGKQALVLLPEIALSAEWLERFRARFGATPAVWHSDLKPRVRRQTWRAVATGNVRVLVGARSALFLPFRELGLIVVDEEHEPAYKQEDGVAYQARDMAVVRARLEDIAIVLVSATPSLETVENVRQGRYDAVHLSARPGMARLPEIELVDLCRHPPERGRFLSPPLITGLRETLAAGEQALLFLNRRGYAPLTLCGACGHRLGCPNCSAWLVEHRLLNRLICHHCGFTGQLPKRCSACGEEDRFVASGPGVERVAEEVLDRFPEARFQIASSDTLTGPDKAAEFLRAMRDREIDVVIGTQMVAKGHNFPFLTLVGVIDADIGLAGGDLRASERTYQLLHQVAGRAGRAERPGRVLLQTHAPDSPVMQALAADDRDTFMACETEHRRAAGMPPFGRLAGLVISATDADLADRTARAVARAAPRFAGVEVLGPAPAPLALLRGRHRHRLLVKATREVNLQRVLRDWLAPIRLEGSARLAVDVEPYNFL